MVSPFATHGLTPCVVGLQGFTVDIASTDADRERRLEVALRRVAVYNGVSSPLTLREWHDQIDVAFYATNHEIFNDFAGVARPDTSESSASSGSCGVCGLLRWQCQGGTLGLFGAACMLSTTPV